MKWKKRGGSVSGGGPLWSKGAIIHRVPQCFAFFEDSCAESKQFSAAMGCCKLKQGLTSLRRFHGYPFLETEGRFKCQTRIAR